MAFLPYAIAAADAAQGYFKGKQQGEEGRQRREARKWARRALPGLQANMLKGITDDEIAQFMPLLMRMAQPGINRATGAAASRFGTTSGRVGAAYTRAVGQFALPGIERLKRLQLTTRQDARTRAFTAANTRIL